MMPGYFPTYTAVQCEECFIAECSAPISVNGTVAVRALLSNIVHCAAFAHVFFPIPIRV